MTAQPNVTVLARAGDVFVEHDTDLFDRFIQIGQRIRYGRAASRWNHAGICIGGGKTAESTPSGINSYDLARKAEILVIPVEPAEARRRVLSFAQLRVGRRYGWLTVVSSVLSLLTGTHLRFGVQGHYLGSG